MATSVPNFIRGTVVPFTALFQVLRSHWGVVYGALGVGAITLVIALIAFLAIDETFSRDMNFVEKD